MVKVPYYDPHSCETEFIFYHFRGDFPFSVPFNFIMETSCGFITDDDLDDYSYIFEMFNRSGPAVCCPPSDYEYIEGLLRSWGCS